MPARFETRGAVNVRREPDLGSPRKGVLLARAAFDADDWRVGDGCAAGWLGLQGRGWVCAGLVRPTDRPPPAGYALIPFDPPTPAEEGRYLRTGRWDRDPGAEAEALLPYIYGRRAGRAGGRIYADVAAAVASGEPIGQLEPGRAAHFVDDVESEAGDILLLPDGRAARLDDVALYAPSRFGGVWLADDDSTPAWVRRGGGRVREQPTVASPIVAEVPWREVLWLSGEQREEGGYTWLAVRRPTAGWIVARRVRRMRPLPPPEAADAPWLDLDLEQQVLTLVDPRPGASFATLVSTGAGLENATPQGLFRIRDKLLHWDMASRPEDDEDDRYHVEEVPFVMHFWPRYALHGAFWHDGFGAPRSHGCVNLAPRDARVIFDATRPALPPGWHEVRESPDEPGTLLRIHRGDADVPDRRQPIS